MSVSWLPTSSLWKCTKWSSTESTNNNVVDILQ
jgi:hypothetical protein